LKIRCHPRTRRSRARQHQRRPLIQRPARAFGLFASHSIVTSTPVPFPRRELLRSFWRGVTTAPSRPVPGRAFPLFERPPSRVLPRNTSCAAACEPRPECTSPHSSMAPRGREPRGCGSPCQAIERSGKGCRRCREPASVSAATRTPSGRCRATTRSVRRRRRRGRSRAWRSRCRRWRARGCGLYPARNRRARCPERP